MGMHMHHPPISIDIYHNHKLREPLKMNLQVLFASSNGLTAKKLSSKCHIYLEVLYYVLKIFDVIFSKSHSVL